MLSNHPQTLLVPYIRNELDGDELKLVADHLTECGECRHSVETFRQIARSLAELPPPPEIHWGAYRAELRRKLAERETAGGFGFLGAWRPRWPQLAILSTAVAAAIALFAVRGNFTSSPTGNNLAFQEALIGEQLDLIRTYPVVEKMDLLEDFDVIEHLDELSSSNDGSNENSHHAGDLPRGDDMAGGVDRSGTPAGRGDAA